MKRNELPHYLPGGRGHEWKGSCEELGPAILEDPRLPPKASALQVSAPAPHSPSVQLTLPGGTGQQTPWSLPSQTQQSPFAFGFTLTSPLLLGYVQIFLWEHKGSSPSY